MSKVREVVLFVFGLALAAGTGWGWYDHVFGDHGAADHVVWWEQAIALGLFSLGVFMMAPKQFAGWFALVGDRIPKFGKGGDG